MRATRTPGTWLRVVGAAEGRKSRGIGSATPGEWPARGEDTEDYGQCRQKWGISGALVDWARTWQAKELLLRELQACTQLQTGS